MNTAEGALLELTLPIQPLTTQSLLPAGAHTHPVTPMDMHAQETLPINQERRFLSLLITSRDTTRLCKLATCISFSWCNLELIFSIWHDVGS